jgi:lipopolysaccharide export system protein LptC
MNVQLHLPDLPEVPVSVGPPPGAAPRRQRRNRAAWRLWLRDLFGASLPLLLMALLAVGTWWLVKHTPSAPRASAPAAPTHEPNYRLENFQAERFDAQGHLALTLSGLRLRHYPDTDEISIDTMQLHGTGPNGRLVEALAQEAWVSSKAQLVRLQGHASVLSTAADGSEPVRISGEQLLLEPSTHNVRADKPVLVTQGRNQFEADALDFDGQTQILNLRGPARAVFMPAKP